jgi:hypothetical protein
MRLVAAALSLCFAHAVAANTPADYAYVFPIETTGNAGETSAWRVELTPDVYRWMQASSLNDIEIFNAEGRPVPFGPIAIGPTATASESRATLPVLDLPASAKSTGAGDLRLVIDRDASGRLRRIDAGEKSAPDVPVREWLIDASAFDHAIDHLALQWRAPEAGVVARVAVEASDDLQSWRNAGNATVLRLVQDGAKLERRDVALGGVRAKYLRLRRLDDGPQLEGLAVEAISIERGSTTPPRVWIDAAYEQTLPEAAKRAGITTFEYKLPAPLPVETARIELANDNALAAVGLQGLAAAAPGQPWVELGNQTAFRLRQGDETLRNDDMGMRTNARYDRFRIEAPETLAAPPHLSFAYRSDSVVFLAEGSGPFLLAAGSAHARHPFYPIDLALASIRSKAGKDWQPPLAKLGAAKASAGDAALKVAPPPVPWRRWLLWAILVAGAALIAGLAISLLRGAKSPPP